ncbi:DUF192 domain-containing protein [Oceanirhabdus sp. W0125-5]|uniref:DUF192 domain-containing protein n=1 Tax=Oceanirhabdus sp. W0125-5 TaxID=2999116 RepID=UPI0022F325C4|nr:DUF192 domain-containing protein [Oceanirhabdus sp. W0125-5]WBW95951.1 DUF192 domain-containing protein [Oceanirhabdus sp. W0125-5]
MKNKKIKIKDIKIADTWIKRFLGLMGKKEKDIKKPLIIYPCRGIHTHFMKATIDIIVLNKEKKIIEKHKDVQPFRIIKGNREWYYVIEFTKRFNIEGELGDYINW